MLTDHTAHKYETSNKGPFVIKQCFTNCTVMLQSDAINITCNIRRIKPSKSDTKVDNSDSINMFDRVNI